MNNEWAINQSVDNEFGPFLTNSYCTTSEDLTIAHKAYDSFGFEMDPIGYSTRIHYYKLYGTADSVLGVTCNRIR